MGVAERKEREKQQRRNDIIDAAEKLFFAKGHDNTTVDDIAKEAELSKGTVYLYFSSKEDLMFGVVQKGGAVLEEMLRSTITDENTGLDNLQEMALAFIEFTSQHSSYWELFLHFHVIQFDKLSTSEEEVKHFFLEDSPFKLLTEIVQKGMDDKSLRNDFEVTSLAATLWYQMMGLLFVVKNKKRFLDFCNVTEQEVLANDMALIINGIKPQ